MRLFRKHEPLAEIRADGKTDYNIYIMSKKEKLLYTLMAAVVLFGIGYVFYKNVVLSLILAVLALKYPKIRTEQIIYKRKKELALQFKDMLYSLSSSLSSGKSVETGFREAYNDLSITYPDPDTDIIREILYIVRGLDTNETIESMLQQFSDRAHIEEIENFTDIFKTCKKSGGDIIQVIKSTSSIIGEKIEVKQEIETMIAGKKFEFKTLMVIPIFLILMLTYTSGDYMAPVFTTVIGRIVMTIAIGLFAVAYFVGSRIMRIEV